MKSLIILVASLCLAQIYAEAEIEKGGPKPQLLIGGEGLYNSAYGNDHHGINLHSGTPIHNLHSKDYGYAAQYGQNNYGSSQYGYDLTNQFSGLGYQGQTVGYGNQDLLGGFGGLQGSQGYYSQRPQIAYGLGFDQHGLGYNQHGLGYSQHGLGYSQHGLGYSQHGLGYNQNGLGYNQNGLGYNQHGSGLNQHGFGLGHQGFALSHHGIGYNNGLNQHGLRHNQHRFSLNQGLNHGSIHGISSIGHTNPQYYQSVSHSSSFPSVTIRDNKYEDDSHSHGVHHSINSGLTGSQIHHSVHKSGPTVHKTVEYKTDTKY